MAELKYWFKRLWCWLTGGCRFAADTLQSHIDERTQLCTLRNRCVRCGMEYKCTIPVIDLLEHEPIRLED